MPKATRTRRPEGGCPVCGGCGYLTIGGVGTPCVACAGSIVMPDGTELTSHGGRANEVAHVLRSSFETVSRDRPRRTDVNPPDQVDVAIITALPVEYRAVRDQLSARGQLRKSVPPTNDVVHTVTTDLGMKVVATIALGAGQLNAALQAVRVMDAWHPRKMLLVGITGGIGSDVTLGDVVVSDQVIDYELGKERDDDTVRRWSVYRSDPFLLSRAANLPEEAWTSCIRMARPDGTHRHPRVHVGGVLSGNKVIASAEKAGELAAVWDRARAIEMEAAGITAAIYQQPDAPSFLMIKGVSDRADGAKDDRWHEYAAHAAAAFAMALIDATAERDLSLPLNLEPPDDSAKLRGLPQRDLREAIAAAYTEPEVEILIFDLELDDEALGSTKTEKIVWMIRTLKQRASLNLLLDLIEEDHPGLLEKYRGAGPRRPPSSTITITPTPGPALLAPRVVESRAIMNPRAFLCHATADKETYVGPVSRYLASKGIDPWVDEWEIRPGDSLLRKVEGGIGGAGFFLPFLSARSLDRPWVQAEIEMAVTQKFVDKVRIIPVLIGVRMEEIPLFLRTILGVRIDGPEAIPAAAQKIVDGIYGISGKPPIAAIPAYVKMPVIQGLNPADTTFLRVACEYTVEVDQPDVDFENIAERLNPLGVLIATAQECASVLSEKGYVKVHGAIGNPYNYLQVRPLGFDLYASRFVENYADIYHRACVRIAGAEDYNPDVDAEILSKELKIPHRLGNHIYEHLEMRGKIELSRELRPSHSAVKVSPSFRREMRGQ
jgi:nucleoside phosphorylase